MLKDKFYETAYISATIDHYLYETREKNISASRLPNRDAYREGYTANLVMMDYLGLSSDHSFIEERRM